MTNHGKFQNLTLEFLRVLNEGKGWVCIQIEFKFGLWLKADPGLEFIFIVAEWKIHGFV